MYPHFLRMTQKGLSLLPFSHYYFYHMYTCFVKYLISTEKISNTGTTCWRKCVVVEKQQQQNQQILFPPYDKVKQNNKTKIQLWLCN